MKPALLLTAAAVVVSAHPTTFGEPHHLASLTNADYTPQLASSTCFASYEEAAQAVRRAEDGSGFAHFDDWGVLTTYDADGQAIEHGVVSWPATVEYFESLSGWGPFAQTGHIADFHERNLTDSVEERIRQARAEKREQGEQPWPRVPFDCKGNSVPDAETGASSPTDSPIQQPTAPASSSAESSTTSEADSPTQQPTSPTASSAESQAATTSRLKPSLPPMPQVRIPEWCMNTPCSSDADCKSKGCDASCFMRDKFLFLSCSG